MSSPATSLPDFRQRLSLPALGVVVGLHAGVLLAVLLARSPLTPATPVLMVDMIAASAPAPAPQVRPTVARPAAPVARPSAAARPSPTLTTESPAPSSNEAARAGERSVPAANPAPGAPATAAAAPGPATSQPRFDADYLDNPAPAYPPLSRKLREEGKVVLRVFVDADGRPGEIQVQGDSGFPRLNHAASEAVRRWKFVPAKRGQEAVGAWVLVPINFSLRA